MYSPFLCYVFYRQHNSGIIYQEARRNILSQPMRRGMEYPPMVTKTSYCRLDSSYIKQIQCFGTYVSTIDRQSNRVGIGKIDIEFNFQRSKHSNMDLFAIRFQSQTSTICMLMHFQQHTNIFCPDPDMPISVQNGSCSTSLSTTNMVLRGSTTTCRSSSSSSIKESCNIKIFQYSTVTSGNYQAIS